MYWVRYHPLKERLKNRSLSDREALPYLLLYGGLEALVLSIPASSEMNKWDVVETILYVLLTLLGIFYVYRRNGGENGYDLIHKFISLGWVVAMRYILSVLPVGMFIYFIKEYYAPSGDETTAFDAVYFAVLSAIYYERLGRHIADTHEPNGGQPAPLERE